MAELYEKGKYQCLEQSDYVELVVDFIELLPSDIVIQRLTGDPIPSELVAPEWARDKSRNLAMIRERLEERDTWQGKRCLSSTAG